MGDEPVLDGLGALLAQGLVVAVGAFGVGVALDACRELAGLGEERHEGLQGLLGVRRESRLVECKEGVGTDEKALAAALVLGLDGLNALRNLDLAGLLPGTLWLLDLPRRLPGAGWFLHLVLREDRRGDGEEQAEDAPAA